MKKKKLAYLKENYKVGINYRRGKLSKLIYEIWLKSHKRYGAPKIHQELIKIGKIHSLKHIQNLMQEKDIRSIIVKKFKPQGGNEYIEG